RDAEGGDARQEPDRKANRTEEFDSNRQQRKHGGNPRVREKFHGSLKAMAAKPAKRFLSAVWKHHYRKNDSQDLPHHVAVSLRQPLKYTHRASFISHENLPLGPIRTVR